jgi:putative heme-binding domain-containing protein
LPPTLDISPGSPTGAVNGQGAKFPGKYQRAIYLLDWTYATIHAVHLEKDGSSYTATREDFVAGAGLPLTDAIIGQDGAMYFATGGRRTAGALWRVTYVGDEPTTPVKYVAKSQEVPKMSEELVARNLASEDRFIRTMARVQWERDGAHKFRTVLRGKNKPQGVITAAVGLARTGEESDRGVIVGALAGLSWDSLTKQQQLGALRGYALAFSRFGEPTSAERDKVLGQIDASFPAKDDDLNAELCRVLCYLQAPKVVERTLKLMAVSAHSEMPDWAELATRNARYGSAVLKMLRNMPPAWNIHYAYCLRVVKGPWTEGQRRQLFLWFAGVKSKSGGNSYQLFLEQLQKDVLATATEEERKMIEDWDLGTPNDPFANLPQAKGPGKNWTVPEVVALAGGDLSDTDAEHGKKMFEASLCAACHRIGGDGGSAGPDLTTVAGRFAPQDLAEALIEPNKTVSDQYNFELITKKDGSVVMGKILTEKDDALIVATNAFDFTDTVEVPRAEIKSVEPSEVSPMPPGLINRLNEEELRDMLGYLLRR